MFKRLTIVGTDGSGKTSLTNELRSFFEKEMGLSVGVLHPPRYEEVSGYPSFFSKLVYDPLSRISESRALRHLKTFAAVLTGLALLNPLSRKILSKRNNIIIEDRHPRIDGEVLSGFYVRGRLGKSFARAICKFGTAVPQVIIHVDTEPEIAIRRVREKFREKRREGEKVFPHLHERSVELLNQARKGYFRVLKEYKKKGIPVIRVNGNRPTKQVCREVLTQLRIRGHIPRKIIRPRK